MSLLDEEFYENDSQARTQDRLQSHYIYWILIVSLATLLKILQIQFSDILHPIATGGFLGYLLFMVFQMKVLGWRFLGMLIFSVAFTFYIIISFYLDYRPIFGQDGLFMYILGFTLGYLIYRARYRRRETF